MRRLVQIVLVGVLVFLLIQLIRPGIPNEASTAEINTSPAVLHILQKDCYSCHSNERRLSWFDEIVPAYWLVRSDILTARERLNFSNLGSKPPAVQKAALYEAVNMIQLGAMPLPKFTLLHPEAKVTSNELSALKSYLSPWAELPVSPDQPPSNHSHNSLTQSAINPEFNGLSFDSAFTSWKLLSITDRGDNNSFRFILGNDIAFKAAQTGNISPWPDGARIAKVAWQQERHADGLIYPGTFIQVELMVKGAHLYKDTDGWGWGRWRGQDLKPYGSNAAFVQECMSCHQPLRGNDYVYTLSITPARANHLEVVNNHAAALPAHLPYNPLSRGAITMFTNRAEHTIAVLYGNDIAIHSVRLRSDMPRDPIYAPGSDLALVTWVERDDPHWFGARIPDAPKSIEFVHIAKANQQDIYRRFTGQALAEEPLITSSALQRKNQILAFFPTRLP